MSIHHAEKEIYSASLIGFPMLIGACKYCNEAIMRSNMELIIKLTALLLIFNPFRYFRIIQFLHGIGEIAIIIL